MRFHFFFDLNYLTKTDAISGCDRTLERTGMCAQYLHEGKKEKSVIHRTYILIYWKKKERFNDVTHLFSWLCAMFVSDGTSRIKDNINEIVLCFTYYLDQNEVWLYTKKFDAYNTIDFLFIIFQICSSLSSD
jgi:hypothetical protein